MYETVFKNASFPRALLELDRELAKTVQSGGCRRCGGRLHVATYPRKPRGGPWQLGPEHDFRHSFCCDREGCRRRTMPPSVRFLGRHVYLSVMVVLGALLQQGATARRVTKLQQELGVDRRTLTRWRRWWQQRFPKRRDYTLQRAAFVPLVDDVTLPLGLVQRFIAPTCEGRLIATLKWLAATTTSGLYEGRRKSAEDAR